MPFTFCWFLTAVGDPAPVAGIRLGAGFTGSFPLPPDPLAVGFELLPLGFALGNAGLPLPSLPTTVLPKRHESIPGYMKRRKTTEALTRFRTSSAAVVPGPWPAAAPASRGSYGSWHGPAGDADHIRWREGLGGCWQAGDQPATGQGVEMYGLSSPRSAAVVRARSEASFSAVMAQPYSGSQPGARGNAPWVPDDPAGRRFSSSAY